MKDKIEVGEYVRLARNQGINKVIDKEDDRYILDSEIATGSGDITWFLFECELKDEITKHSKQLIDLIEVGDFVNGMEVLDIHIPRDMWEPIEIRADSRYTNFILAEDIKTILTKESYMANCYKVGEEDE